MRALTLSDRERSVLEGLTPSAPNPRAWQRAQAVLWLDEGESVAEVAEQLRVSRQTIYNWATRVQAHQGRARYEDLLDAPRSGRPRTVQGIIAPLLDAVLDEDPRSFGYRATGWTAPLLRHYLAAVHHLAVSRQSVSLALARLRVRWKRPRHTLARRSPTWPQAQGGLNVGCESGNGRSA
jgi:transposase